MTILVVLALEDGDGGGEWIFYVVSGDKGDD